MKSPNFSSILRPTRLLQASRLPGIIIERTRQYQLRMELPDILLLLASLLDVGIGIDEAVRYTKRACHSKAALRYVSDLWDGVREGRAMSTIHTELLPSWLAVLMYTAEHTGDLARVLRGWAEETKEQQAWVRNLRKKAAYPLLLFAGTCLVLTIIGRLVLPEFARMYTDLGLSAPVFLTTFLKVWTHGSLILLGALVGMASSWTLFRFVRKRSPRTWNYLRRKLPGHRVLEMHRTYRLTHTLWLLTEAGLPLAEAAFTVTQSKASAWLRLSARQIAERVVSGVALTKCFEGDFHPMLSLQIERAEASGDLVAALQKVQSFTRQEFASQVERLLQWVEPILSVVIGLMVGVTMFSLYVPMYTLISNVSAP